MAQLSYLILGNGNVSRHLQHYLRLTQQTYVVWHRGLGIPLKEFKPESESYKAVLFAVTESAIADLKNQLPQNATRVPHIHFSGSFVIEDIHGFHPLMTFSGPVYDLETYQSIPFVCEKDAPSFKTIFPQFSNPQYLISKNLKPLYHAWCSLSGNLSTFLWESAISEFKTKLNLPADVLVPYLKQSARNVELAAKRRGGASAITGPLSRGDMKTVRLQLEALKAAHSPAAVLYEAFVTMFEHQKSTSSETTPSLRGPQ